MTNNGLRTRRQLTVVCDDSSASESPQPSPNEKPNMIEELQYSDEGSLWREINEFFYAKEVDLSLHAMDEFMTLFREVFEPTEQSMGEAWERRPSTGSTSDGGPTEIPSQRDRKQPYPPAVCAAAARMAERSSGPSDVDVRTALVWDLLERLNDARDEKRRSAYFALYFCFIDIPKVMNLRSGAQLCDMEKTAQAVFDGCGLSVLVRCLSLYADRLRKLKAMQATDPENFMNHHGEAVRINVCDMKMVCNLMFLTLVLLRKSERLRAELKTPDEMTGLPLCVMLLTLVADFEFKSGCFYPVKKMLMLLWKAVLYTLGGTEHLQEVRQRPDFAALRFGNRAAKTRPHMVAEFDSALESKCWYLSGFRPDPNLPKPFREAKSIMSATLHQRVGQVTGPSDAPYEPEVSEHGHLDSFTDLYAAISRSMHRYVRVLLMVLVPVLPTVAKYDGHIHIRDELATECAPYAYRVLSQEHEDRELARHKEIILRSVSCTLLLLLKHARATHMLMAEYLSQLVVDSNGILLLLKSINHDINKFLVVESDMPMFEILAPPNPQPIVTSNRVNWRNFISVVNLLRIFQKLTKGKPWRVKTMMQYKPGNIVKKLCFVMNPLVRYYTLKLLKTQMRFYGLKWRQGNIAVISDVFKYVRLELVDDWLTYEKPNEEALAACYRAEDSRLRLAIAEFNQTLFNPSMDVALESGDDGDAESVACSTGQLSDLQSDLDHLARGADSGAAAAADQWIADQFFSDTESESGSEADCFPEEVSGQYSPR
eukprot:Rmarinus@m.15801